MTTGTVALIIIGAIVAQVAVAMLLGLYRRRSQYRGLGEHVSAEETTSTPQTAMPSVVEPAVSTLAWEGFREFTVQRRVMEDGNSTICSFYLVPVDGKPLPNFKPGQFLTFKLSIDDPLTHQPKAVVRCYSLSDTPRPDYYRITVKRVPAPDGHPDIPPGLSSNFFHDHVQEGSRLLVKAPSGHFHLMEDEPLPIVLIGGGIGITPMLSTLNFILEREINRELWLYYGVRNGDEVIMKEHLQLLAKTHDNFHLHFCYSDPHESEVEGVDYQHSDRVGIPLLRATLKLMRYQFYVCGPKQMMESLVPGLENWGVDSGDIYYESFGPATLIKHEKPVKKTTSAQSITVTFSKSRKSISWDTAVGSLLELAEVNGIEVESGCRAGSCGCCQTAIKSGEVDYNQEADADVEPEHCLLCISTPRGDLILEA
ncbi:2Fe-2S iron-sulfur cluster-binding protein [Solemya velum gill symbiont]|uniref:2Fe-2S iron-sulfur cluster-binding protein n=1 Tax=Solemya velum gill symbiont TaxID=2340 RepID=UPI000996BA88|nr:2Fe-2S iron-sulfur cluster-binding protein [Solemya velum gill symbiont]OOZ43120.1 FAD/NAD(P)-binding oxidoreductase [Solemya velum gill symbiont]OOZ43889.1 FAD/NAD(P)-binding oxidoreductase [Solemya velum gill symbiont]OOZ48874.1 FAD/NAD(P)-binding oxidoreductase [Solemya velum gill symbiont]OOZ52833.1 FAD/NAD(P)-binding oxidoreductase [Solemya velum gill symbiont]OOZ53594.1 FAD/NAD(P)-binding oxidoreductase [Solemya velum gill symbiont]